MCTWLFNQYCSNHLIKLMYTCIYINRSYTPVKLPPLHATATKTSLRDLSPASSHADCCRGASSTLPLAVNSLSFTDIPSSCYTNDSTTSPPICIARVDAAAINNPPKHGQRPRRTAQSPPSLRTPFDWPPAEHAGLLGTPDHNQHHRHRRPGSMDLVRTQRQRRGRPSAAR